MNNEVSVETGKRQSQVGKSILELAKVTEDLKSTIEELEKDLTTILRKEEPAPTENKQPIKEESLVPLCEVLNEFSNRLKNSIYQIRSIKKRIEL